MSIHVLALATNATQDWYNELGKTAILNLQNLAIIYFLSFLQLSSNVDSSRSAYFLIIVLRALIAKKKKKLTCYLKTDLTQYMHTSNFFQ